MTEILTLAVGACGWKIFSAFNHIIHFEHFPNSPSSSSTSLGCPTVFYRSSHSARAILIDTDPEQPIYPAFDPTLLSDCSRAVSVSSCGCGNNWAKGMYTDGAELFEDAAGTGIVDLVRREMEEGVCGLQMVCGLGGGTGGGLGSRMLVGLEEELGFPGGMLVWGIIPSPKSGSSVVRPYNAVLSLLYLTQMGELAPDGQAAGCALIDQEVLYDLAFRTLRLTTPRYEDLNHIVAATMANVTCPMRFRCQSRSLPSLASENWTQSIVRLPQFLADVLPLRQYHFLVPSIFAPTKRDLVPFPTLEAVVQGLQTKPCFLSDPRLGKRPVTLASRRVIRGSPSQSLMMSSDSLGRRLDKVLLRAAGVDDLDTLRMDWIPGRSGKLCVLGQERLPFSGSDLANTNLIAGSFERLLEQFQCMFRRKAFLHWYTGEGMDEMEFTEAESSLMDLYESYRDLQIDEIPSHVDPTSIWKLRMAVDDTREEQDDKEERITYVLQVILQKKRRSCLGGGWAATRQSRSHIIADAAVSPKKVPKAPKVPVASLEASGLKLLDIGSLSPNLGPRRRRRNRRGDGEAVSTSPEVSTNFDNVRLVQPSFSFSVCDQASLPSFPPTAIQIVPPEVLDIIATFLCSSVLEIVVFSRTCRKFHEVIETGNVWATLFRSRFPNSDRFVDVSHVDVKTVRESFFELHNAFKNLVREYLANGLDVDIGSEPPPPMSDRFRVPAALWRRLGDLKEDPRGWLDEPEGASVACLSPDLFGGRIESGMVYTWGSYLDVAEIDAVRGEIVRLIPDEKFTVHTLRADPDPGSKRVFAGGGLIRGELGILGLDSGRWVARCNVREDSDPRSTERYSSPCRDMHYSPDTFTLMACSRNVVLCYDPRRFGRVRETYCLKIAPSGFGEYVYGIERLSRKLYVTKTHKSVIVWSIDSATASPKPASDVLRFRTIDEGVSSMKVIEGQPSSAVWEREDAMNRIQWLCERLDSELETGLNSLNSAIRSCFIQIVLGNEASLGLCAWCV